MSYIPHTRPAVMLTNVMIDAIKYLLKSKIKLIVLGLLKRYNKLTSKWFYKNLTQFSAYAI